MVKHRSHTYRISAILNKGMSDGKLLYKGSIGFITLIAFIIWIGAIANVGESFFNWILGNGAVDKGALALVGIITAVIFVLWLLGVITIRQILKKYSF